MDSGDTGHDPDCPQFVAPTGSDEDEHGAEDDVEDLTRRLCRIQASLQSQKDSQDIDEDLDDYEELDDFITEDDESLSLDIERIHQRELHRLKQYEAESSETLNDISDDSLNAKQPVPQPRKRVTRPVPLPRRPPKPTEGESQPLQLPPEPLHLPPEPLHLPPRTCVPPTRPISNQETISRSVIRPTVSKQKSLPAKLRQSERYASLKVFAQRRGFSEELLQQALQQTGMHVDNNRLLEQLVRLKPKHAVSTESTTSNDSDFYEDDDLRSIVIDGSNVAMRHGNNKTFSCKGIQLAVDFFRSRGHKRITVFVPQYRKETSRPEAPISNQEILDDLEREEVLVFTPSRRVRGRRVVCYDDRYILKLAVFEDGVVVSNDFYRDLTQEEPKYKRVVDERLLMYSFANDRFMPPDDPLGRHGPTLSEFLSRSRGSMSSSSKFKSHPAANICPYGAKCTYGPKCKFDHTKDSLSSSHRSSGDLSSSVSRSKSPALGGHNSSGHESTRSSSNGRISNSSFTSDYHSNTSGYNNLSVDNRASLDASIGSASGSFSSVKDDKSRSRPPSHDQTLTKDIMFVDTERMQWQDASDMLFRKRKDPVESDCPQMLDTPPDVSSSNSIGAIVTSSAALLSWTVSGTPSSMANAMMFHNPQQSQSNVHNPQQSQSNLDLTQTPPELPPKINRGRPKCHPPPGPPTHSAPSSLYPAETQDWSHNVQFAKQMADSIGTRPFGDRKAYHEQQVSSVPMEFYKLSDYAASDNGRANSLELSMNPNPVNLVPHQPQLEGRGAGQLRHPSRHHMQQVSQSDPNLHNTLNIPLQPPIAAGVQHRQQPSHLTQHRNSPGQDSRTSWPENPVGLPPVLGQPQEGAYFTPMYNVGLAPGQYPAYPPGPGFVANAALVNPALRDSLGTAAPLNPPTIPPNDNRYDTYVMLSQIFPEKIVRHVMHQYPQEYDKRRLCSIICTLTGAPG